MKISMKVKYTGSLSEMVIGGKVCKRNTEMAVKVDEAGFTNLVNGQRNGWIEIIDCDRPIPKFEKEVKEEPKAEEPKVEEKKAKAKKGKEEAKVEELKVEEPKVEK